MWRGSFKLVAPISDVTWVVFFVVQALQLKAIIWIGFVLNWWGIFVVIFIIVIVFEPFREFVHYLRIGLRLDPSLEVPDDVLIVQATQVGYLATNSLVLLWIQLIREKDLFDGVYIAVEAMSSLIYYSKATSTDFLKLIKVISVARDLSHVVEYGVIMGSIPSKSPFRLLAFIDIVIGGGHCLLSSRILILPLTRLAVV